MFSIRLKNVYNNLYIIRPIIASSKCLSLSSKLAAIPLELEAEKSTSWNDAKPFSEIPGPNPLLIFLFSLIPGRATKMSLRDANINLNKTYGDIVSVKGVMGRPDIVITFNPKDFEQVYRNEGPWPYRRDFDTFRYFRNELRPDIFGEKYGLVATQGEAWKEVRGKVNPVMMQPRISKQYIPPVEEVADEFIERMMLLRDANNEMPSDFRNELNKWSLESIARIALDSKLGCLKDDSDMDADSKKMIQAVHDFFTYTWQLEVNLPIWKYFKTPAFHKLMNALNTMTNVALKKVEEAERKINNKAGKTDQHEAGVLEKLLRIDRKLATVMAMDMLTAGIDTTSSSVAILLYFLASNQTCQDKLRKEILTILPNKNSKLSNDAFNHMPYLRACMKETNRVLPITGGNVRKIPVDLVLSGYQVPKGSEVVLSHSTLSVNENQFPNPEKFMPERWLSEEQAQGCPLAKNAHPFIHMPFGFGPRSCVGRRFAELEIQILTTKLLRNYKVEWNHGEFKISSNLLNHPISPLRYKITEL